MFGERERAGRRGEEVVGGSAEERRVVERPRLGSLPREKLFGNNPDIIAAIAFLCFLKPCSVLGLSSKLGVRGDDALEARRRPRESSSDDRRGGSLGSAVCRTGELGADAIVIDWRNGEDLDGMQGSDNLRAPRLGAPETAFDRGLRILPMAALNGRVGRGRREGPASGPSLGSIVGGGREKKGRKGGGEGGGERSISCRIGFSLIMPNWEL